jgi:hypothetical protein
VCSALENGNLQAVPEHAVAAQANR